MSFGEKALSIIKVQVLDDGGFVSYYLTVNFHDNQLSLLQKTYTTWTNAVMSLSYDEGYERPCEKPGS